MSLNILFKKKKSIFLQVKLFNEEEMTDNNLYLQKNVKFNFKASADSLVGSTAM